jgi:hypothetical protein
MGPQQKTQSLRQYTDHAADQNEQDDRKIGLEIHVQKMQFASARVAMTKKGFGYFASGSTKSLFTIFVRR